MYGMRRHAYGVLVGGPEGKRPLERPRHRLEIKIKFTLEQAMKAQRWNRGIVVYIFLPYNYHTEMTGCICHN
jgi:hypothetical protein